MSKNLEFQLYDWTEAQDGGNFIIHSFGRTDDDQSVYAKITGFKPYFYFFLPNIIQDESKETLEIIIQKIAEYFKNDIPIEGDPKKNKELKLSFIEIQLVKLKKAEGFTNDKEFWFAKVVFNNVYGMSKYIGYLEKNEILISSIPELSEPIKYKLYEAKIDTTFCLINLNYPENKNTGLDGYHIRIANNYTCKHLPWYNNYIKYKFSNDELEFWLNNNISSSILKNEHVKKHLSI